MTLRSQIKLGRFSYETEIEETDPKIAEKLNEEFGFGAKHARYHIDGTFYNPLDGYPAVLFDLFGYVEFKTELEVLKFETKKINIHRGIHTLQEYKKYPHEPKSFTNYNQMVKSVQINKEKLTKEKNEKFKALNAIMQNAVKKSGSSSVLIVSIIRQN